MTTNDEHIEILRKAGYFKDGEDAYSLLAAIDSLNIEIESLQEKVKEKEEGWDRCWRNYKNILLLSIDMMDSFEIMAEFEESVTVRFDRELFETFDDQIAQMVDLPELYEEDETKNNEG
jgi:hypothetical protein